jgi:chromosome segregation ATPase
MSQIENAIVVSPLDDKMEQALSKVNVTNYVIDTLKAKYGDLKLRSMDDKEMYLEIKVAAKEVAKVRNAVVKVCKEGREEAVKIQKQWIAKEKEVIGRIAEVENPLDAQIEAFDNHAKDVEQAGKKKAGRAVYEPYTGIDQDGRTLP